MTLHKIRRETAVKGERNGGQAFNPSTLKGEAGSSPGIPGQPCVHSKFQINQNYKVRPVPPPKNK